MEIDINQHKISIGDKYKIYTNGEQSHTAAREIFHLLPVVNLFGLHSKQEKLKINKRLSWFRAKYDITFQDNTVLQFRTRSYWGLHYECRNGDVIYDIHGHKGRKYSVFNNGKQVAWWNKQAVSWFAGDNYKIIADNNADADLIIAFCLIIDNFVSDDHDEKTVTYDIGNLGFFTKKFDYQWQPQ